MKDIMQDLIKTNQKVLQKSVKIFSGNLALFFLGLIYVAILYVATMSAPMFGFLGGLILYLLEAAVISDYLYIINQVVHNRKFDLEDFKAGFKVYFVNVYAFLFLYFIVMYGYSLFLVPVFNILAAPFVLFAVHLFIVVIFNALPETIYQKHLSAADTLHYSLEFIKENAVDWLVPNAVLMGLLYLINTQVFSVINMLNLSLLSAVIAITLTSGVVGFGMIYRGVLFDILSKSTRKKRIFTYNMYKN